MVQEGVGLDREHELVAIPGPLARGHVPTGARAGLRGGRERLEIVLAQRERGACIERGAIDRGGMVQRARGPQRRARPPREHAVLVPAREGREARVEPRPRLAGGDDRDVVGEQRAQRVGGALGRWAAVDHHAQHLMGGVDAGIGAPGDGERRRRPGPQRVECVADGGLDRPTLGLAGPTGEARSVVLERQAKRPLHRRTMR